MAIESANIPLPSEVILPFGGYLVSQSKLTFWGAVLAGTAGGTFGSIASYALGSWGGLPLLLRYGRYVHISEARLEQATRWFDRYGEKAVFFARLLPVIRTFISLPAGIARMNFGRFVVYTFLGSLPWSALLTYVGVKLGENWRAIEPLFRQFDIVIILAVVGLIIYYWWRRRRNGAETV
ncbi:MAG TPA: DedA family protein [Syntrophomonadaceae bacterium]|nr:DedA family protein [Syntrophomonadaceae bacterium]